MKSFATFMLLLSVLAVSFLNRAVIGVGLYFGIFALMPLWIWMFYYSSYVVTEKQVRQVRKDPFSCSFMASRVSPLKDSVEHGRLVVDRSGVEFYLLDKDRSRPVKKAWSLKTKEIRSFAVGKVEGSKSGVIFYLDGADATFYAFHAEKRKAAIMQALGWQAQEVKPTLVDVGGEAADAPSFSEALKEHEQK